MRWTSLSIAGALIADAVWSLGCGSAELPGGQPGATGAAPLFSQVDGLYFGEVHAHSSNSFDAERQGAAGPAATLAYARDLAGIDFAVVTDHAETIDALEWRRYREALERFNQPGRFVALGGWEWTSAQVGHKNVYFRDGAPERPIGSSGRATRGHDVISDPAALWQALRERGDPFFTAPHHPAQGVWGFPTDWSFVDEQAQPLVEIFSKHGSSDVAGCPEPVRQFLHQGSVSYALSRWLDSGEPGYQLGIIAGTDDHTSRPGCVDETPECQEQDEGLAGLIQDHRSGGLTAVFAPELTREAIFDAMAARRVYATSGPRIVLTLRAQLGGASAFMGETIVGSGAPAPVALQGSALGDTAPIDRVEVFVDEGLAASLSTDDQGRFSWDSPALQGRHLLRIKAYQEETLSVDGELIEEMAWSSPIWIEN